MFAEVKLVLGETESLEDVLGRVARFVGPCGGVEVVGDGQRPLDEMRRVLGLATPDRLHAKTVEAALKAKGLAVTEVTGPVLMPRECTVLQVLGELRQGHTVLWGGAGEPAESIGLWVPSAATTRWGRSALAWLGETLPGQAVQVFTPVDVVDDFEGAEEILGSALKLSAVALSDHEHGVLGGLAIAMSDACVDVLTVAVPPSGVVAPMLAALRGLDVDLLLVSQARAFDALPGKLEAYDAVSVGGTVRVRLMQSLGRLVWTPEDRSLHPVRAGAAVGTLPCVRGMVELPPALRGRVGLCSDADAPVASLEAQVEVLGPAGAPIALVPTVLSPGQRRELDGHRLWAVALEALNPEVLRDSEDVDAVLDPDAVLDRGDASDVPESAGNCTMDRMLRVLRMAGYPVRAVVWPVGGRLERLSFAPTPPCASLGDRLQARCGAVPVRVDAAGLQLDNRHARTRLLELMDGARSEIELQVYIYEVDDVGGEVRDALVRAARRGVRVRVLVDALWSGHGSLSRSNRHLSAIESEDGAEVRTSRPLDQLSSLKARNHRKLVLVDRQVVILAGRNVGDHYYRSFSEVKLAPTADQRTVPWFDLSVELRGPVVEQARQSFDQEWEGREVAESRAAHFFTSTNAWWVGHHALRDAHGLDTLRELLAYATDEVVLVNTFALAHELRHAVLDCLRRGVRVRIYTGHVRPRFFGGATPFLGSPELDLATGVIHGRFDPLVAAGAQAWALGVREPGWDADLGLVLPHVHSKLVVVDGHLSVLGSHNLDIASCYWESELMLVLDDASLAGRLLGWLRSCESTAVVFHGQAPAWRQSTRQPGWLSRNWPSLLT